MNSKLNIKYEYLNITFLIIAVSIFFIPPILNINNISFKIDDIVILFILPFTILLLCKELKISIYLKILSSVFLSMLFSTLYGYIVLDVPFNMRDVNELIRMLKPLLLFSFLLLIDKGIYKEILFKFLILAMMFFIFVGLSESLKIPYLNDFFINIYSSEFQDGVGRINATTLNPNDGAVITLFFLFFSISMLITYRKYYYMISSILLIYILLNTGSRTAFLIAIVFFLLFFIFTKAISVKNKIILLIFIFIGLISIYPYMSSYINRILTLLNAIQLKDASLNIRFGLWKDALEIFYQSKIFGWGVAKGIHDTVVDGEHFILLRRYGLIGFSLVILAMIYPLYVIKQRIRINQLDSKEKVLYYTLFAYLGSGLFVMFTNNFFTHYILVFPYILIAPVLFKR